MSVFPTNHSAFVHNQPKYCMIKLLNPEPEDEGKTRV